MGKGVPLCEKAGVVGKDSFMRACRRSMALADGCVQEARACQGKVEEDVNRCSSS